MGIQLQGDSPNSRVLSGFRLGSGFEELSALPWVARPSLPHGSIAHVLDVDLPPGGHVGNVQVPCGVVDGVHQDSLVFIEHDVQGGLLPFIILVQVSPASSCAFQLEDAVDKMWA